MFFFSPHQKNPLPFIVESQIAFFIISFQSSPTHHPTCLYYFLAGTAVYGCFFLIFRGNFCISFPESFGRIQCMLVWSLHFLFLSDKIGESKKWETSWRLLRPTLVPITSHRVGPIGKVSGNQLGMCDRKGSNRRTCENRMPSLHCDIRRKESV